ncbi:S24 family peptidase [Megasphaera sp.]|uniref:LexA family protein n=1 Tax=Megasphaera sp. TaxID=2023260 RepID=UPI00307CCEEF
MNGKRLKMLREEKGLTQKDLAEKLSLTPKAISFYELGSREPSGDALIRMAHILGTTTDYLLGNSTTKEADQKVGRGVRIPVLGRVVAGIPIEAVEEILDYEEITPELAATGEFFALKIRGHSMEPRMMEGDVVIVRRQDDVDSGDVAIVLVNGDEATVKRVKKQPEGITLIATNTSVYEPHFYSNKEIADLPVRILGRVVELRGKM